MKCKRDDCILTPVTHLGMSLIVVISVVSSIFALLIFGYYFAIHGDEVEGRSLVFASFSVNSLVYIFAYRSMRRPLWQMAPLRENQPLIWTIIAGFATVLIAFLIPGLRNLLRIVPLTLMQWGVVAGVALILLVIVEIAKIIANHLHSHE